MRLVDDYLYITTSYSNAREFVDVMNKGAPTAGALALAEYN
jgi:hypothetical protein